MTEPELRRRQMLAVLASGAAALCCPRLVRAQDESLGAALESGPSVGLAATPARWWKNAGELRIECELCPNKCRVADRERGTCGVRENRDGKYYTLVYGRPCSIHIDPVEKKPFFHVLPGATAFSLAAPGCNIQCKFCQNWEISQVRPEQVQTFAKSPEAIAQGAKHFGSPLIACTYSEPVVWSEYVFDIAAAAQKAGLKTLMVSNGYIEKGAMNDLCGVLGAVKIDLKAMTEKFYKEQCVGKLAPVLDTLRLLAKHKMWTEIVTLVIPGLNDSEQEARDLARFVKNDLGPDVPVHFTRFHPSYRLQNVPSTPVSTLTKLRDISMAEGLSYVYVGNVPGHPGNNTYCPGCHKMLIKRLSMVTLENRIASGKCPDCKRAIAGIWS